ncbi:hypothetical protein [Bradyrhizobium sp. RP6]|nr:hypothetical protein [Bradyrhizobium sp. RP6]
MRRSFLGGRDLAGLPLPAFVTVALWNAAFRKQRLKLNLKPTEK